MGLAEPGAYAGRNETPSWTPGSGTREDIDGWRAKEKETAITFATRSV
jgi:hypothetical protein